MVPWGNYEVAHINFSEKRDAENEPRDELGSSIQRKCGEVETSENCYHEERGPIVGWHRDSYPFVCILMLSDCYGMVGGETIVLTADGEIKRIQSPAMVRNPRERSDLVVRTNCTTRALLLCSKVVISLTRRFELWGTKNASPQSHRSGRGHLSFATTPYLIRYVLCQTSRSFTSSSPNIA